MAVLPRSRLLGSGPAMDMRGRPYHVPAQVAKTTGCSAIAHVYARPSMAIQEILSVTAAPC
jgi:hypothetical protein